MKPTSLLLTASLVANLALVGVYVTRSRTESPAPSPANKPIAPSATVTPTSRDSALRDALAAGDAAALQAAGLSPSVAREIALARALGKIADRARTARAATTDASWWRARGTASGSREQQLLARRELTDALSAAFGDTIDLGLAGAEGSQFAFLSPEKRDALRRITQDYDEMMAKFSSGGVQLASDREKLRLLRAERDRDIAALLTPAEQLAYDMRTSPSGATVRNRYGDAIESEAEFQKIFALQKTFDEKFPRDALTGRISPETLRARSEAERQLEADLRAAVGADRFSALRRSADPDVRIVDGLVSRLNLPPATTNQVLATRESFATESQRIAGDAAAPFPQRRTQIQELAARAKSDLTRALGGEAADAYAQSSSWMNMLQSGSAYATTPQPGMPGALTLGGPGQSVYPVIPAGVNTAGATRQVFINNAPALDGAGGGNIREATTSNVQVMTFGTSGGDATVVAPSGERSVIVVPAHGSPPSTTTPPR